MRGILPSIWAMACWSYFGYPAAHEDDAARAVRAGLEIVAALQHRAVGATAYSALSKCASAFTPG